LRQARRIDSVPPYLFAELDKKVAAKRAEGVDVISLGVGDPDMPTPPHIVEALEEAARDPSTHRYPSYFGLPEFREAVARWYKHRFDVDLDPDTEVMTLIGSKEGLGHLSFAFVDPGDEALVPDPGYPVYGVSTVLAGGTPVPLPMPADSGFLPDFSAVRVGDRTKILWLNFPSNPTAAVAGPETMEESVAFAREHDLVLAHDAAYSEITYDGYVAPSVLQAPGAKEVAIEFNSLSKFYNMTGWRIGFCAGSADAIRALSIIKTNLDSGQWNAIQRAGVAALNGPQDHIARLCEAYRARRDVVVATFNSLGWKIEPPKGAIYVWLPVPEGETSASFADRLLSGSGVFVAPGRGYGVNGEGYIRIALTVPDDRLQEAMQRITSALE
jgi:LL-diaminopimelate aminotransferase